MYSIISLRALLKEKFYYYNVSISPNHCDLIIDTGSIEYRFSPSDLIKLDREFLIRASIEEINKEISNIKFKNKFSRLINK